VKRSYFETSALEVDAASGSVRETQQITPSIHAAGASIGCAN
jgi:hypothetical protein